MQIVDIIWDTDGEVVENLPKEIEIPNEVYKNGCSAGELVDWASDEYGFCISSCSIKAQ